ncbi:hypothetical protein AAEO57_20710 [Flavobacterium sp. DGU38]|uniref:MORN repeat variant n=1 Tax=Flavobacterium calami TaxID=3139144 RepID=A0ABU9IUU1_9FLAO
MKKILILLIYPSLCFSQTSIKNIKSEVLFKGPLYIQVYSVIDTLVIQDKREIRDSLNFQIVREKYKSGHRHFEVTENRLTKEFYWRQYYQNGNIKEEGAMTKDELIRFGDWKFYSENGNLNKKINFDSLLTVPYLSAIEIAKKQNYLMPEIEIDLEIFENKLYWQIRKWIMKYGDGMSSTILVDTNDGHIIKPKEEVERHN